MSRRREASFTSSTPRPASHAAVEMLLCRHTARHTQQDSSHLRGLQLCTRLLVVTGFSTRACDPEDLLSPLNGGARGTAADTGTENLLTPETARGVRAADLSKLGTDMTPPEGSSASPACGGMSAGPAGDATAAEAPVITCNSMGPPILLERAV